MNKKIFTLFAGALLLGSAYTVSAQTSVTPYPSSPYQLKYDGTGKKLNEVAFRDSLTIDSALKYQKGDYYYVISITGIANADPSNVAAKAISDYLASKPNSQLALFVDGDKATNSFLRIDTVGNLDYLAKYNFPYKSSTKFGAIRRASWCVSNKAADVTGSNRVWDFVNLETGNQLEAPMLDFDDETALGDWDAISNGHIYKKNDKKINVYGDDLIVSGWHFSQTFDKQDLQTSMPLYSYVSKDSVVVLVVDEKYDPTSGAKTGGYPVTVKQISVNDLVADAKGTVRTGTAKDVQNVLLFSLKKINPFVLNADDYNAVNDAITFDQDANMAHGTDGWNPFTKGEKKDGNNGMGWLTAEEVSDSLYHYGYMYMKNSAKKYLYVDTAFWNTGNTKYLSFNWSDYKRDTLVEKGKWGAAFIEKYASKVNFDSTYLQLHKAATTLPAASDSVHSPTATRPLSPGAEEGSSWIVKADSIKFYKGDYNKTATQQGKDINYGFYTYKRDSVVARYKDSIMENQSKFRVVYDPWEDNAKINVYQTRYAYPNLENHATTGEEWPNWWVNSFAIQENASGIDTVKLPWMKYGPTTAIDPKTGLYPDGDREAYNYLGFDHAKFTTDGHRISNTAAVPGVIAAGHGQSYAEPLDPAVQTSWHSFMSAWEKSSPNYMDRVMVSTADTAALSTIAPGTGNLAHEYSHSLTREDTERKIESGMPYYQDSLFYVTIQDLDNGINKIATIAQNGPQPLREIHITYSPKCKEGDDKATIGNNLYLIRNSLGQYLCVPIWSATDSIYWANPEHGEDPSRMPCYQWAVENVRGNTLGSPFKLTNREFERVSIPYVYVYANKDTTLEMAGKYAPKFNNRVVYSGISNELTFGMKKQGTAPDYKVYDDGNDFIGYAETQIPLSSKKSFIPLDVNVKGDQLLGYKYIDKDSTIVDVYALKYKHFITSNAKHKYVGWNGYENVNDTTLYVKYESEFDKLYFDLKEMPFEDIQNSDSAIKTDGHIAITKESKDFASIYNKYAVGGNLYTNSDSLVMEKFGYMPTKNVKGQLQYDYSSIDGLKPLARQAYRFMLKDYYKFSPTIQGDFLTVGENDNYILADKVYATKKYTFKDGNVVGVFGIPYFYLRNTFFDYAEKDENEVHDYFALVQRLDTVNLADNSGTKTPWNDIYEYLTYRFGSAAAGKVKDQVKKSNELGVFVAVVEDYTATLKMAVRGDAAIRVSTFRLAKDEDPIYRRFHGNDRWKGDGWGDTPDTLEFHRLNRGDLPLALYENAGNYTSFYDGTDKSLHGVDGGRVYNYANADKTELLKDSLGNVISFLGVNNLDQYPGVQDGGKTNYSIFVDTAFINRGTGWIKPQYLLAVDPFKPEECNSCSIEGGVVTKTEPNDYVLARYLFNTSMYAKQISDSVIGKDYKWKAQRTDNFNVVKRINFKENSYNSIVKAKDGENYCDQNWERLAFAWAIHKGDSLYVLKGIEPAYEGDDNQDPARVFAKLTEEYGKAGKYIDFKKLIEDNTAGTYKDIYYPGYNSMKGDSVEYRHYKTMAEVKANGRTIGLQAIINLADNTHKDWVFSMRYVERNSDDFVIESETTNRDTETGPVIRPGYGGWVKYQNGVPVITRSDQKELMGEGLIMNVQKIKFEDGKTVDPVSNDAISTSFAVVAGTGNVTILNASGKKVVISNILGQTVANTVISSDNASIAVPAGVVVVAVEGETAVKAVVK